MEQWLVRTASNWISGPFSKEQVCQMISEKKISLQDEVCVANGYWIALHETEEVFRQLGVQLPRTHGSSEEVTDSEITLPGAVGPTTESPKSTQFSAVSNSERSSPSPASSHPNSTDQDEKTRKGQTTLLVGLILLLFIAYKIFRH